jgi:hypothetical protein
LCSFLLSPVTSSLFGPNILFSTLFSNTLGLCSSLLFILSGMRRSLLVLRPLLAYCTSPRW